MKTVATAAVIAAILVASAAAQFQGRRGRFMPRIGENPSYDGAGAARVYTLAGIIRYTMPYLDPGSLTDEDAQQVAAYITSQPRPRFPFKEKDYVGGKVPVDAVYYHAER